MCRGVAPLSVVPWPLLAPDSTRNRTISSCPFSAAMNRGVAPSFVRPWSLLAPDSTRNRTISSCPFSAAMKRGVAPSFVRPWSLLAPDSTSNRTTSRCRLWEAMCRGVAPLSVLPWSLLAPDSTSNRTTSRCLFRAAMYRGVAPVSTWPFSLSAPASSSRSTHLRLPSHLPPHTGVWLWDLRSVKIRTTRGCFRCREKALCHHVATTCYKWGPDLAPQSGGQNCRITSCTTAPAERFDCHPVGNHLGGAGLPESWEVQQNRAFFAVLIPLLRHLEFPHIQTQQAFSPLPAYNTSIIGRSEAPQIKKPECLLLTSWNILNQKLLHWAFGIFRTFENTCQLFLVGGFNPFEKY